MNHSIIVRDRARRLAKLLPSLPDQNRLEALRFIATWPGADKLRQKLEGVGINVTPSDWDEINALFAMLDPIEDASDTALAVETILEILERR